MRRVKAVLAPTVSPFEAFVCYSCRHQHLPSKAGPSTRRFYAVAASAPTAEATEASSAQSSTNPIQDAPRAQYRIKAGNLVSRAPLLTAPLTPFESSFFFYQRRLNERLALPFSQYFYFKRNTPAYETWKARRRERGWAATRDIGPYNAHTNDAWNDEILVGDKESDPEVIVKKLVEEDGRETFRPTEAQDSGKPLRGLRRTTEADRKHDTKSLERALTRTLYLLIKREVPGREKAFDVWQFPDGIVEGTEGLRQAAERSLQASCGPNMNTWFVANHPVGHYTRNFPQNKEATSDSTSQSFSTLGEKTFFIKSRILAGKADIPSSSGDILDYQWLSKDEIEKVVTPNYWSQVKHMLAER